MKRLEANSNAVDRLFFIGEGREVFDVAMKLALHNLHGPDKVEHFSLGFLPNSCPILHLHWAESLEMKSSPLPYPMNAEGTAALVWGWLESLEVGHWPKEGGGDGDYHRGFTIDTKLRESASNYGLCSIIPSLIYYGK